MYAHSLVNLKKNSKEQGEYFLLPWTGVCFDLL